MPLERGRSGSDHASSKDEVPSAGLTSPSARQGNTQSHDADGKPREPRPQTPEFQTSKSFSSTASSPTVSSPLSISLHNLGISFSPFTSPLRRRLTATQSHPPSPAQGVEDELGGESGIKGPGSSTEHSVISAQDRDVSQDKYDTMPADSNNGSRKRRRLSPPDRVSDASDDVGENGTVDGQPESVDPYACLGPTGGNRDGPEDGDGDDNRGMSDYGDDKGIAIRGDNSLRGDYVEDEDIRIDGDSSYAGSVTKACGTGEKSPGVLGDGDDGLLNQLDENHGSPSSSTSKSLQGTASTQLGSPLPVTRRAGSSARSEEIEGWPSWEETEGWPLLDGRVFTGGVTEGGCFQSINEVSDTMAHLPWSEHVLQADDDTGRQTKDGIEPRLYDPCRVIASWSQQQQQDDGMVGQPPIQSPAFQPEPGRFSANPMTAKQEPEISQPPAQDSISSQLALQASVFQAELDRLLSEMKHRKEESEHMHALLLSQTAAATRRVEELEGVVASLNEDLSTQTSDLRHLHLQLIAITVLMDEFIPPGADQTELLQSIQNWKADYLRLREEMAARRVRREGTGETSRSSTMSLSTEGWT